MITIKTPPFNSQGRMVLLTSNLSNMIVPCRARESIFHVEKSPITRQQWSHAAPSVHH